MPHFLAVGGRITAFNLIINVLQSNLQQKEIITGKLGKLYKMVNFHVLQKESDFDTHVKWVG
jgi:hypothetical protein